MSSYSLSQKKESRVFPKKWFSQNFLTNLKAAKRIVDYLDLRPGQNVLEIGPGKGVLTKYLLEKKAKVFGVELDRNLCRFLQEEFKEEGNLEIINQDILKFNLKKIAVKGGTLKVIGNIPYKITTPILEYLIQNRELLDFAILTMQKEVAKRICANPGTPDWSPLSIGIQLYSDPEILFMLKPNSFHPPPHVYSAVLRLDFLPEPRERVEPSFFSNFIKALFSTRRKNLLNSLSKSIDWDKEKVKNLLEKAGIENNRRAETLSLEELARLIRLISEKS
ncbi:MAG: 16S rRNA (adenine(1518)-N(6)/adenine(1519)-N(6))-dimethyltransferase RsmA [candidate division Zixibacteria bacterium]|nr:16S rRNA (adenine(1518)-N(6)/adenine(1519)-N(6))-dimethyltransferase RsmA [candidate division Zixibacteria bacterium]